MSMYEDCAGCGLPFKRLEGHLAQNMPCKSYYKHHVNVAAAAAPTSIPTSNADANHHSCPTLKSRTSSRSRFSARESGAIVREEVEDFLRVDDSNELDNEEDYVMFDDDDNVFVGAEGDKAPDVGVLD
jgi:hypothetical protein